MVRQVFTQNNCPTKTVCPMSRLTVSDTNFKRFTVLYDQRGKERSVDLNKTLTKRKPTNESTYINETINYGPKT